MHLTQSGAAGGLRRRILEIAVGVGGRTPFLPARPFSSLSSYVVLQRVFLFLICFKSLNDSAAVRLCHVFCVHFNF